ncbi:MAG: class I SAM-dependent methyltransferase [Hydrogenothermaceae bacterium]
MKENLSSKRYEISQIDLSDLNSSLTLAIKMIGFNKRVLEIGTSTGYVSKVLKERGNYVVGVEIDPEAAKIASKYCDEIIVGNIEVIELEEVLRDKFDVILLGDVLEHLIDPWKVLRKLRKFLKKDGFIVASIPNIAHGDVIISLLNNKFEYTEKGFLDMTHLRFFTKESILSMFESCGYTVKNLKYVKIPVGYTELSVDKRDIPQCVLDFISSLQHSDVYQYVFRAYPAD